MIVAAIDAQRMRPELSGLPLLRVAMKVLPPDRRRKLIAITQAIWFEKGCEEESHRRLPSQGETSDIAFAIREVVAAILRVEASLKEISEKLNMGNAESHAKEHAESHRERYGERGFREK